MHDRAIRNWTNDWRRNERNPCRSLGCVVRMRTDDGALHRRCFESKKLGKCTRRARGLWSECERDSSITSGASGERDDRRSQRYHVPIVIRSSVHDPAMKARRMFARHTRRPPRRHARYEHAGNAFGARCGRQRYRTAHGCPCGSNGIRIGAARQYPPSSRSVKSIPFPPAAFATRMAHTACGAGNVGIADPSTREAVSAPT